jgi:hypothetical protein
MDEPPYLQTLPLFPDYAFGIEKIDGLVPACRVESWEKFIEAMQTPDHNRAKGGFMYRGQAGHAWPLSSTLSRLFDDGSVPHEHEESLLHEFRLAMRGRGLDLSNITDDREVWALGQHHGLCTPLIDWTKSPYVALFFAFDEMDVEGVENPSRAVFCLNMTAVRENLPEIIFEPTHHENARLVNQAGLFTITLSGGDNLVSDIINELAENGVIDPTQPMDVARFISKIHVPNNHRVECLNTLRKMNIHHANLFPDPGGASRYCNDWLSRLIEEERRDEAAAAQAIEDAADRALAEPEIPQIVGGPVSADAIAGLLGNVLRGDAEFPPEMLAGWAPKLITLYERTAETDWPDRPASQLRLKLAFRKFLMSNGVNPAVAGSGAKLLVELFEASWRANNAP